MNPEAVFLQRMVLSYSYGVLAFQTASVDAHGLRVRDMAV